MELGFDGSHPRRTASPVKRTSNAGLHWHFILIFAGAHSSDVRTDHKDYFLRRKIIRHCFEIEIEPGSGAGTVREKGGAIP